MRSLALLTVLMLCLGFRGAAQTVYITSEGKKYHTRDCQLVKTGGKAITLAEARQRGYEPCKGCKADLIRDEKETSRKKPAPRK